jgi:hypothetical protein
VAETLETPCKSNEINEMTSCGDGIDAENVESCSQQNNSRIQMTLRSSRTHTDVPTMHQFGLTYPNSNSTQKPILINQIYRAESFLRSIKNFHGFYKTRRFVTLFKTARHLFLSRARRIQCTLSNPTSLTIHFNIIVQPSIKFAVQGQIHLTSLLALTRMRV